jgi:RHS repeat-associated protein
MTGKLINLSYSSENQVVGINIIEDGNTVRSVEYSYDALGRRSQKKIVENSTEKIRKYIYDGNEILAELNGNNSVLVRYTHSGLRTDDTLAMDVTSAGVSEGIAPTSGTYHFLKDGLGSIIDITDSAGTLIQHYVYGSFGKILKITNGGVDSTQNPLIKNSFTFTNREYDVESGFYHYRARMYDSHSGRFLQEDPHPGYLSQASTFNSAYIYSLNNPINRVDPSGRMSFWKALGISLTAAWAGGVAGGAAGAAVGGPWGVVVGVVVGAVVGAVTAVAVNGIMNSVEGKTFFYEWEQAAIIGAIAGGIAGGRAAYNEIYSTGRVPASVENPNADVDGVNNDFLDMDECIRAGKPGCLDESMLTPDPTQGKENQLDKAYEIRERNLDRLLWGK